MKDDIAYMQNPSQPKWFRAFMSYEYMHSLYLLSSSQLVLVCSIFQYKLLYNEDHKGISAPYSAHTVASSEIPSRRVSASLAEYSPCYVDKLRREIVSNCELGSKPTKLQR